MRPSIQLLILLLLGSAFIGIMLIPVSIIFQILFIVVYFVLVVVISFSIILERRSSTDTMLWIFLICFVPIIGYFFYIYSGQLSRQGLLFQNKRKKANKVFQEQEPEDYDHLPLKPQQKRVYNIIQSYAETPLRTENQVNILTNGYEAFPKIMEKLKQATSFIHMEYYLFNSDETGEDIITILINKAQEGVKVRLLYDSAGSIKLKKRDIKRMRQAGVEVHEFLPLASGLLTQTFNFRNHRKIIVIDNEMAFVGGMNIGDEYRGISQDHPDWRDTHTIIQGKAIKDLHLIFLVDWWYIANEYLVDQYSNQPVVNPKESNTMLQVVPSGPHNEHQIMRDVYTTLVNSAEHSVKIATPYFIPSREIHTALRIAAQRGVEVTLLIPKQSDSWLAYYAGHSYFPELLEDGINIYLYEKDFMHHKIMIIDDETASVGTANMDVRSFYLNFEVNIILYDGTPVQDLTRNYHSDLEKSQQVMLDTFSKRKNSAKFKEAFARLFSPLL
ncbi:cardiolipin synthase [Pontibacillus yanchengensis]|uniref:Cardiolipin synthase n=3 Tax=Pontibacillus yanchengensis TaxID=462910 RepID=A0ACC7VE18_9BACI|nr:cardiolipin synthase [Pontibacillus yanchengensis]MYL32441.1 cardiolipin synthase [Pontibacillus yanchengensis]MYL53022.1 cardiolipin synthase [Pontibacillus yanchengensis]